MLVSKLITYLCISFDIIFIICISFNYYLSRYIYKQVYTKLSLVSHNYHQFRLLYKLIINILTLSGIFKTFLKKSYFFKCHIQIETNVLGYAIRKILNQLTSDFGQQNPITYFLKKIILAKIRYKIYNEKLPAIIEVFKTCHYYLESYKYEVSILTNYNNLCQFINTKILSF